MELQVQGSQEPELRLHHDILLHVSKTKGLIYAPYFHILRVLFARAIMNHTDMPDHVFTM